MADADLVGRIEALEERLAQARQSIARRFIGQERVVDLTLAALLCGGTRFSWGCRAWARRGSWTRWRGSWGCRAGASSSRRT
jgi:hypothetical protein